MAAQDLIKNTGQLRERIARARQKDKLPLECTREWKVRA
jgi:hypothetical protein